MNLRDTLARKWFSQSEYLNSKTLNDDEKALLLSYKKPTINGYIIPVLIFSIELNHYFTVKHLLSAGFLTNIKTTVDKNTIVEKIIWTSLKIFKLLVRNYFNLNYIVCRNVLFTADGFNLNHNNIDQNIYFTFTILSKLHNIANKWKDHAHVYYVENRKKINYNRKYQLTYKYIFLCKHISAR
jgi:hypothetical protein